MTMSLCFAEPSDWADSQDSLPLLMGAVKEVVACAQAKVAEMRTKPKRLRMLRAAGLGMNRLLGLHCLDETRRKARGACRVGQFRECHRKPKDVHCNAGFCVKEDLRPRKRPERFPILCRPNVAGIPPIPLENAKWMGHARFQQIQNAPIP